MTSKEKIEKEFEKAIGVIEFSQKGPKKEFNLDSFRKNALKAATVLEKEENEFSKSRAMLSRC